MAVLRPSESELLFDSDYDAEHERNLRNRQQASDGSATKKPNNRTVSGGSDPSLSNDTLDDQKLPNQVGAGVRDDLFQDAADGTTTNE